MKADVDGSKQQSRVALVGQEKKKKDVLSTTHFYVAFSL